jgi:hypothetical protein
MSDEDKVKESIKFNIEAIKLLTLLFITTGGGAVSLIAGGVPFARHVILAAAGMMFSITSGILAIFVYRNTKKLING